MDGAPAGPRLFAVGDVHGDVDRLAALLRGAGLLGRDGGWTGGEGRLVLTGDLTDRGDRGRETIDLVRRLQADADGRVESLMGNHDALLLARASEGRGERADPDCRDLFVANGGREREARALSRDDDALAWLADRPLMLRIGRTLFQHADGARFYAALGDSVGAVDAAGRALARTARGAWRLFAEMTDARDWDARLVSGPIPVVAGFEDHLARFGARRVVHGHTRHLETTPRVLFGGRAINVDGTLSAGYRRAPGRGFVADLGPLEEA